MENKKKSMNIRKIKKQVKGITLIALVVTIIVLLILAGIALNLTIGQNGIFTRAQKSVNTWRNAETNEQLAMGELEDWMDGYLNGNGGSGTGGETTTVGDLKPGEGEEVTILDETTEVEDGLENKVVIPGGFGIASDSGTNVEDGIVIEDEDGNQFVWIPVSVPNEENGGKTPIHTSTGDITIDYARTAYSINVATGEIDDGTNSEKINFSSSNSNYFTEAMPSDELQSVNANGGYYIGRYEAGDGSSTEFRTSATEGTVVIKKNQIPYNYITRSDAETKATEISTVQEYTTATTKLVSSYAWDTALDFIQKANSDNEHSDYATSSPEGNYSNTDYGNRLIRTGQTTPVSNIYDMGGNLWEYTTESYSDESFPYVLRGGYYNNNYDDYPAGYRSYGGGPASSDYGFRTTLYCSTES